MLVNERNPELKHQEFDNDASLKAAAERLPLDRMMSERGDTPPEMGKKWGKCPFCKKKSVARLWRGDGGQMFFKCANDTCPSQTSEVAWTELKYFGFKTGLTGKELFKAYLKEAGVWVEREKFKRPAGAKQKAESRNGPSPLADTKTVFADEDLLDQAMEVGRTEGKASVSLLQRRLRIGFARATRLIEELERRGKVGPATARGERELIAEPKPAREDAPPAEETILPPEPGGPAVERLEDHAHAPSAAAPQETSQETTGPRTTDHPGTDGTHVAAEGVGHPEEPRPDNVIPLPGAPSQEAEKKEPAPGVRAMQMFYARLEWSAADAQQLWEKRGLEGATQAALGFRSNPRANEAMLTSLVESLGWEELLAAGLALPPDKKRKLPRRLNSQFHGKGQAGKKAKEHRRDRDDKVIWGWCEPVLIPYFDEQGELVRLRPHKGGAPSGTVCGGDRLYVPRRFAVKAAEQFFTVIICEGEFKAAALWQMVGLGSGLKRPLGVCAVPGISYGKNIEMRAALEDWLMATRCQRVIVSFDDEDKSGEPLEKRFDALKWARYLATDLHARLGKTTLVHRMPPAWRNAKGKADWDGALVKLREDLNDEPEHNDEA